MQAGSRRRQGEREFQLLVHEDVDVGHGPVSRSSTEVQLLVKDVSGRQGWVSLVWEQHSSTSALEMGNIYSSTSQDPPQLSQNPRAIEVGKGLQDHHLTSPACDHPVTSRALSSAVPWTPVRMVTPPPSANQNQPVALTNCFNKDQAKTLELPRTPQESSPTGMEWKETHGMGRWHCPLSARHKYRVSLSESPGPRGAVIPLPQKPSWLLTLATAEAIRELAVP